MVSSLYQIACPSVKASRHLLFAAPEAPRLSWLHHLLPSLTDRTTHYHRWAAGARCHQSRLLARVIVVLKAGLAELARMAMAVELLVLAMDGMVVVTKPHVERSLSLLGADREL
jgi:hypothetical protein